MRIGFTGTRDGMTEAQKIVVRNIVEILNPTHLHHGDCLGADADFHEIGRTLGKIIKGHPPTKDDLRAFCDFDEENRPFPYLTRDRHIVEETAALIATPKKMVEESKGGTWYTVGYARLTKKPAIIVWPDGSFKTERMEGLDDDRLGVNPELAEVPSSEEA